MRRCRQVAYKQTRGAQNHWSAGGYDLATGRCSDRGRDADRKRGGRRDRCNWCHDPVCSFTSSAIRPIRRWTEAPYAGCCDSGAVIAEELNSSSSSSSSNISARFGFVAVTASGCASTDEEVSLWLSLESEELDDKSWSSLSDTGGDDGA